MNTIAIQTRTMDFVGGIVPEGHRYYQATIQGTDNPHKIYYKCAMEIPIELMATDNGLSNVSWPNKNRDMNPKYKGSRNQLSRRILQWLNEV